MCVCLPCGYMEDFQRPRSQNVLCTALTLTFTFSRDIARVITDIRNCVCLKPLYVLFYAPANWRMVKEHIVVPMPMRVCECTRPFLSGLLLLIFIGQNYKTSLKGILYRGSVSQTRMTTPAFSIYELYVLVWNSCRVHKSWTTDEYSISSQWVTSKNDNSHFPRHERFLLHQVIFVPMPLTAPSPHPTPPPPFPPILLLTTSSKSKYWSYP